ncbi:MAG: tail fiber domain-containing protein [Phycisphaerales bacterium]|nr:tail fiber domain-containing protein [Phycisphaerales bacterium]
MRSNAFSSFTSGLIAAASLALAAPALAQSETEPNNSIPQANGPFANAAVISASFNVAGDVDYFRLTVGQIGNYTIAINNGIQGQCVGNGADPTLTLYDANGNQIAFNDDFGAGFCPRLNPTNATILKDLAPGTYYIKAALLSAPAYPLAYTLQINSTKQISEIFTYQGRLNSDGKPFTGYKQVTFSLWTDPDSQDLGARVSLPLQAQAVEIVNGLFTQDLEFPIPQQPSTFDGTERYLQIEIAEVGGADPVVLSPRTRLNPAPSAIYALRAGDAARAAEAAKATLADFASGSNSAQFADSASFANSVPWSGITGKPAAFADNTDNTGGWNESSGVTYTGNQVAINTGLANGFDLAVNGTAAKTGGGSWSNYSDARLKHDITPLKGTLDRLLQLRGYSFEYNADAVERKLALPGTQLGLIAQEVQQVFPDWVQKDKSGYLFVTERATTALMVEALRDLRTEKDTQLEALRKAKDAEIADLKARLERLEKAIEARR